MGKPTMKITVDGEHDTVLEVYYTDAGKLAFDMHPMDTEASGGFYLETDPESFVSLINKLVSKS